MKKALQMYTLRGHLGENEIAGTLAKVRAMGYDGAEPDTCWLYSGGVDPAAYLTKYADRSPVIHPRTA